MTDTPRTDLDLLAKRLSRSRRHRQAPRHSPTTRRLTELRHALQRRLDSGRVDLKLLALQWQYDLALLLDQFRHWMQHLDRDFGRRARPDDR